jgi:hypothetical protein
MWRLHSKWRSTDHGSEPLCHLSGTLHTTVCTVLLIYPTATAGVDRACGRGRRGRAGLIVWPRRRALAAMASFSRGDPALVPAHWKVDREQYGTDGVTAGQLDSESRR